MKRTATDKKLLTDLKAGDDVLVCGSTGNFLKQVYQVTPNQIIVSFNDPAGRPYSEYFNRTSGHEIGNMNNHRRTLRVPDFSGHHKDAHQLRRHYLDVLRLNTRSKSDEQVDVLYEFLRDNQWI